MFKKITVAILGLTVGNLAFAGMYSAPPAPSCTPADVTVPCEEKKWDLAVQALYLQPIYTADRGYERRSAFSYKNTNPEWGWGYRIEGSYHFHTGNDVTMSLMHYDIDTDRGGYIGPTRFATSALPYSIHAQNKFDQVNFVLGQRVDMGAWKKARFYGGLQYAKIRFDMNNNYRTIPPALLSQAVFSFQQFRNTDFDGIGPVIGINYSYDLAKGFSVTANTASSILYGSTRYTEGYVFSPSGLVRFPGNRSTKIVVPSLEAKLGIKYVREFAQGVLNLEGGFQALNYFRTFESRGQVGFGVNTYASDTDFGLYGPYFGIKWVGNI